MSARSREAWRSLSPVLRMRMRRKAALSDKKGKRFASPRRRPRAMLKASLAVSRIEKLPSGLLGWMDELEPWPEGEAEVIGPVAEKLGEPGAEILVAA